MSGGSSCPASLERGAARSYAAFSSSRGRGAGRRRRRPRRRACAPERPTTSLRPRRVTVVVAVSAEVSLTIVKWRSASEAICGRWVMQMTWRPAARVAQLLADGAGRLAADPGIDLVEHQRGRPGLGRHPHQREHHARDLAAGCRLAQRAGGHAGVGRDQELHLVAARGPVAVALRHPRLERRALHGKPGEALSRRPRRASRPPPGGRRGARRRCPASRRVPPPAAPPPPRAPPRRPRARRAGAGIPRRGRETSAIVPPCLRFSRSSRASRSSTCLSLPGGASTPSPYRRSSAARSSASTASA